MPLINFITERSERHSARDKLMLPDLVSSVPFPCNTGAPDSASGELFLPKTLLSNQLQGYKCGVLNIQYMGVEINFFFFSFFPGIKETRMAQLNCTEMVWNPEINPDLKQSSVFVYRLN